MEVNGYAWPTLIDIGTKNVQVTFTNPRPMRANPVPATVAPIAPNRPRPNVALGPAPPIEREILNRGRQPRDGATPFSTAERPEARPEQRAGPSAGPTIQNVLNRLEYSHSRDQEFRGHEIVQDVPNRKEEDQGAGGARTWMLIIRPHQPR